MSLTPSKAQNSQLFEEFSKKKYLELESKNPSLTATQIKALVRKEWFNSQKKAQGSLNKSASSAKQVKGIESIRSTPVNKKLEFKKQAMQREDVIIPENHSNEDNNSSDEILGQPMINVSDMFTPKTKTIKKQRTSQSGQQQSKSNFSASDKRSFFTTYKLKLHKQHSKWSVEQINTIVELLWKKRLSNMLIKTQKARKIKKLSRKPMSGRGLFSMEKREQGFTADQIKIIWAHLPMESRKYWATKGASNKDGFKTPQKKIISTIKFNDQNTTSKKINLNHSSPQALSFMNKII